MVFALMDVKVLQNPGNELRPFDRYSACDGANSCYVQNASEFQLVIASSNKGTLA